ncbi:MAG TPA: class I SAM-dependent methyltransferase [Gammaproteobacteria bacterium]|jgi:demethylmenaquinone methyltransferase/2-methoxy-6-polyprenyl-1,4-benzoquinol methylase
MTDIEKSMQSYYAARAREYDRIYLKPERQADIVRLQHWLPPVFKGLRLLEVACGTGFWTQFIAPSAVEVVAVDAAPETLAIARQRVTGGKVSFLTGDAYCLPKDQGTFNAAFAGFWFSHVPTHRRRAFLAGLHELLEPGATVVLLDNLYVHGSNHPISERDDDGNTYQSRRLADGSVHRVMKNFPSEAELLEVIGGLGEQSEYTKFEYFWVLRYAVVR